MSKKARRHYPGGRAHVRRGHVIKRARERYGLDIKPVHIGQWVSQITSFNSEWFVRDYNGYSQKFWIVDHEKQKLPVIYSKNWNEIVTVLPPEVFNDTTY